MARGSSYDVKSKSPTIYKNIKEENRMSYVKIGNPRKHAKNQNLSRIPEMICSTPGCNSIDYFSMQSVLSDVKPTVFAEEHLSSHLIMCSNCRAMYLKVDDLDKS